MKKLFVSFLAVFLSISIVLSTNQVICFAVEDSSVPLMVSQEDLPENKFIYNGKNANGEDVYVLHYFLDEKYTSINNFKGMLITMSQDSFINTTQTKSGAFIREQIGKRSSPINGYVGIYDSRNNLRFSSYYGVEISGQEISITGNELIITVSFFEPVAYNVKVAGIKILKENDFMKVRFNSPDKKQFNIEYYKKDEKNIDLRYNDDLTKFYYDYCKENGKVICGFKKNDDEKLYKEKINLTNEENDVDIFPEFVDAYINVKNFLDFRNNTREGHFITKKQRNALIRKFIDNFGILGIPLAFVYYLYPYFHYNGSCFGYALMLGLQNTYKDREVFPGGTGNSYDLEVTDEIKGYADYYHALLVPSLFIPGVNKVLKKGDSPKRRAELKKICDDLKAEKPVLLFYWKINKLFEGHGIILNGIYEDENNYYIKIVDPNCMHEAMLGYYELTISKDYSTLSSNRDETNIGSFIWVSDFSVYEPFILDVK